MSRETNRTAVSTMRHFLRFNVVGTFGIAVQLVVLGLLVHACGVDYLFASLVAVEASVLHNYVWHTRWTWADRLDENPSHARMLARFHLTSASVSLAANWALMPILVGRFGLEVLVANAVTIAICGALNFALSDRFAFV